MVATSGTWTGRYVVCLARTISPSQDKVIIVSAFMDKLIDGEFLSRPVILRGVAQTRWAAQYVRNLVVFLQQLHEWRAGRFENVDLASAPRTCVLEVRNSYTDGGRLVLNMLLSP